MEYEIWNMKYGIWNMEYGIDALLLECRDGGFNYEDV